MIALTIGVILAVYVTDILLITLNFLHRHYPVPESVMDVYDPDVYQK